MRRAILFCLFILSPLTATARADKNNAQAEKKPNILFAFADDWGRQASAYAKLEPGGISDAIQTPNFDRLAREGVLFRNAYVNAVVPDRGMHKK